MFIFEWIEHYINTPEMQRTIADEALCGCQNRVNERKGGHIVDEQREADTDEHL